MLNELERLWEEGFTVAIGQLGKCYRDGIPDAAKAKKWFRLSAEADNDFFKYALGNAMLRGKNYHKLADHPNIEVLLGKGAFLDARHVKVDTGDGTVELEADQIFIKLAHGPLCRRSPA